MYGGTVRFRRSEGGEVLTWGVVFSGKITVKHVSKKGFEVWKKAPCHVWSGNYQPWRSVPASYWIVEVSEVRSGHDVYHEFKIVEEHEPGLKWKKCLTELIEKADELGGVEDPEAAAAFKAGGI